MSIDLTSTAFQKETTIPNQYTGDGADQSPPLHWSEPPSGTKCIALIFDDPDPFTPARTIKRSAQGGFLE